MTVALAVPDVIVARAQAGDEAALEALYRAFETPVYNLVRRILRRPEDAEDVRETESLEDEPGKPGMHVAANIDLERAFERLSETSRAVVWLHDVEGYTHEEIAEQMGKTVSFSKSQLARAHARLRGMLDEGAHA